MRGGLQRGEEAARCVYGRTQRKEAQSRKLLDDIARIRKVCVPLKKTVRNGDILKTRERQAQRRFVEKVDLLRKMEIA